MRTGRQMLVGALLAMIGVGTAACHHAPDVALAGSRADVVTREELEAAGSVSVYDVIARAHSSFFRNRGPTSINSSNAPRALVFMLEQPYGEIEALRNIPAERIESIRFYSGTDAASKFGKIYNGGVIQLVPRYQ